MQPSSLVFLVIIGVWAAYFVQYWVRRREHLATARSVDQFSESMRVLERRSPLPVTDLSTPQPRSYAVSPARAARPQILVKRAEPATRTATGGAPAQTRTQTSQAGSTDSSTGSAGTSNAPRPAARRARAMIMLGALSTVVVAVPLVALSLLPLVALLVPVACVGAAVTWARTAARAQRRDNATRHDRPAARGVARPTTRVHHEVPVEHGSDLAAGEEPHAGRDAAPVPAPAPRGELFDVQAVEAGRTAIATTTRAASPAAGLPDTEPAAPATPPRPLVDEDDIPLTWDPVPVPRPTYTMKARVTRPAPKSADLVGDADTEYAAYEEVPERRVAGA